MGQRFGAYRLRAAIGGGGLGEVFAASLAEGVARPPGAPAGPLAIKRLRREHLGEPELIADFRRECELQGRLDHPRLARAFDHGEIGGLPYLAMLHAGPADLSATALSVAGVAAAARALGDALDHLHAAGIVHADVSPGNVVVGEDGAVTLVDFGAATELGSSQRRTAGTFAYMAPEQARGRALTAATDQFALAAILWEKLAGARLFRRAAQHLTLVAVVEEPVPRLADPALAEAAAVLERGLSKEPAARYPSCSELAAALVDALP